MTGTGARAVQGIGPQQGKPATAPFLGHLDGLSASDGAVRHRKQVIVELSVRFGVAFLIVFDFFENPGLRTSKSKVSSAAPTPASVMSRRDCRWMHAIVLAYDHGSCASGLRCAGMRWRTLSRTPVRDARAGRGGGRWR